MYKKDYLAFPANQYRYMILFKAPLKPLKMDLVQTGIDQILEFISNFLQQ